MGTCDMWYEIPINFQDVNSTINILRPRENGRHFADDSFKCIFLNENFRIWDKISLKFVPNGQINNVPSLVQIMVWRLPGKPLSEPMMVRSLTHICVTRPQWVNISFHSHQGCCSFNATCPCLKLQHYLWYEFNSPQDLQNTESQQDITLCCDLLLVSSKQKPLCIQTCNSSLNPQWRIYNKWFIISAWYYASMKIAKVNTVKSLHLTSVICLD